ncbi:MAG: hypothetical protein GYA48_04320 [Chloroflexi bacterium]|nr:hypothetical protein [Chloroflexota bacterium]
MQKKNRIQWMLLTLLAVVCVSAVYPSGVVQASSLTQDPPPSSEEGAFGKIAEKRLEIRYARAQRFLEREQREYDRAVESLPKLEERIATMQENGKDTSALEAMLPELESGLAEVSTLLEQASAVLSTADGFDNEGQVVDMDAARETLNAANADLDDAHMRLKNLMYDLRKAYRAFREANPIPQTD